MKKAVFLLLITTLLCGCIIVATEMTFFQLDTKIATILYSDTTYIIGIGSVDHPYSGTPAVKIKTDDVVIFDSSMYTSNSVPDDIGLHKGRDLSHKIFHSRCLSLRSDKSWGEGSRAINLLNPQTRKKILPYSEARQQGIEIVVQDNALRAIRIQDLRRGAKGNMIQIKIGNSPWMDSQLSKKECIQLFGKPIKERKYLPQ